MYTIGGKRVFTFNPFVGCKHGCTYCYARKIAKRQKHRCINCYNFVPHEHPERLDKKFPKGSQVFVCSMGDISFASMGYINKIIKSIQKQPDVTFLIQTKYPFVFTCIDRFIWEHIPDNIIFGITIESTYQDYVYESLYKPPDVYDRVLSFARVKHARKYVTIEPIMNFEMDMMVQWIKTIQPEFVYIGYDNHNHHLPEPSLENTLKLIEELEKFTEVRKKTIRKAWWENEHREK
jgi:DNA repair photolyase